MDTQVVDIVVIGAGPAGLSAALYAARSHQKVVVLEKDVLGGQMMITAQIENVPGSIDNDPFALTDRMVQQAKQFGAEFRYEEVTSVSIDGPFKTVTTTQNEWQAKAVILATGANPRRLGLQGEEKWTGRGLTYCATCDGPFFQGLPIYVVGGGDAAFDESLYLHTLSDDVTILYRGAKPRAAVVLQERAREAGIKVVLNTEVVSLEGENDLDAIVLRDNVTGEEKRIKGNFGLFIYVGMEPNTGLVKGQLALSPEGYVEAAETTETSVAGVYAAGDVRYKDVRQIVTALSDGASAAIHAVKYIEQQDAQ
ncbi:MAG: FAD-dependent oxidoreductase [Peptoniphilaceae bacterium]|nr:FAD-dependent oxidoreductase [Peptoniphilaceae bacterium]MDY6085912.1 FAD-dependent oxidoreductase [Peptoniphilaceae bacterium]